MQLPKEIIHELILPLDYFPNNSRFPLLIYKQVFKISHTDPKLIKNFLKQNNWINSWVDGIYDYHHYHSNTHEALVIIEGQCEVQIGGDKGKHFEIFKGDVIIFPAGVAHKRINATIDFKCVGSYPINIDYDMYYGTAEEHPMVDENIKNVGLPESDPIFGPDGFLFDYWK